jgi:hypothetical protein
MACIECERRRREMKIWAEAAKLWAEKPFGPNLKDIYARLWAAAKARGEFDDLDRPHP